LGTTDCSPLLNEKSELQKIIVTDVRGIIFYNNTIFSNVIQLKKPTAGIYIISLFFKDKILTSKFAVFETLSFHHHFFRRNFFWSFCTVKLLLFLQLSVS